MSGNRKSVVMRFNIQEQRDLQHLCEFYNMPNPQDLLRLAYQQFVLATRDLKKKLKEAQDNADQNSTDANGDGGTAPADDPGAQDAGGKVPDSKPAAG